MAELRLVNRAKNKSSNNSYSFIVGTANMLLLVKDGIVTKLMSGWFYGISWDKKQIYLMNRASPDIFIWTGEDQITKCKRVPFSYRIDDTHQILWRRGILYVTHSGRNRIETWDGHQENIVEWTTDIGEGTDHINSIWCNEQRFYVCEHRWGNLPARIRVFDLDFTLIDTLEFYYINTKHLCGIHNVYIESGLLYTLSIDKLLIRNLATDEIKSLDIGGYDDIGYLRGFARDDNYFYIGESAVSDRADRRKGDSRVLILDNNLTVVDIIELEGTGQLHDIRLLTNDLAHNGIDCPIFFDQIATFEALPGEKLTKRSSASGRTDGIHQI